MASIISNKMRERMARMTSSRSVTSVEKRLEARWDTERDSWRKEHLFGRARVALPSLDLGNAVLFTAR